MSNRGCPSPRGGAEMRVRSWGLLRNRERVERVGPGWRCVGARGNRQAPHRKVYPHPPVCRTMVHWERYPWIGGIMFSTMRKPLVAVGAGDHCLLKLHRQPYMFACLVPTQIALSAFAPFEVCNPKAHTDLPCDQEIARVRCQCLRLQCGAVRIGSVGYVALCGSGIGQSGWGILRYM